MNSNFLEISQQVAGAIQGCEGIRDADPARVPESQEMIEKMGGLRGRPLLFPMMPTGRGSGPFIEMADGSVKLDMITGIGVSLFGHNHPSLILEAIRGAVYSPAMQGTLMPGKDYMRLSENLIKGARGEMEGQGHLSDEAKSRIAECWLTTCGSMANELAMKIVRQKKSPAFKGISLRNAFAGRSATMAELTDEPKYREGQPFFHQFDHIDFYSEERSLEENISHSKEQIETLMNNAGEEYCVFVFEPVQGEGGAFRQAPRDWWVAVLDFVKEKGLAVWLDEVQTFGRTGELYAFQRLELGQYVDVVTVAKPIHSAAVLWTEEYRPKPGLIAGTFAGSSGALAIGAKSIEMLCEKGFLGPEGHIQSMERFIIKDWQQRCESEVGKRFSFGKMNIIGGMVAIELLDGTAEKIKSLLLKMFDQGVLAFSAGKSPVCLRFLPPMGVLKDEHWKTCMTILEKTLEENMEEFLNVSSS
jgi:4-aminobutyrate aminotransferase-like enzyme